MWTQVPVSDSSTCLLEKGDIAGLIVVSDLTRLPHLHSRAHRRLGRVYNPLNPFFARPLRSDAARYRSLNVAFAGYMGESKGAHRVLQLWPYVREALPGATLAMAGSHKLYADSCRAGEFGVAAPEFEECYVRPLVDQFGSLECAGIEFTGLLSPGSLRGLYQRSALGFVNFNWDAFTETFCCVATEMLATQLPVFSFAAGALPETIGQSGGAVLCDHPDPERAASVVVDLLKDPQRLQRLGEAGRRYVTSRYDLDRIADCWERLLAGNQADLERASGEWGYRRGVRYWVERTASRLGAGRALACAKSILKSALGRIHSPRARDRTR